MRIAAVFNTAILCSGEFRTQLLLHKYSSPSPHKRPLNVHTAYLAKLRIDTSF